MFVSIKLISFYQKHTNIATEMHEQL